MATPCILNDFGILIKLIILINYIRKTYMRISTKQIAVFVAIAKQENVSKAAKALHLTQAAASMGLAELESQLGRPLFDRFGKKLIINQTGEMLLPKAIEIIDKIQEFEGLAKHSNLMTGELKIGASTTIGNYLLPKLISKFVQHYPEVKVCLQVNNTEQIIDQMKHFQLDVGFIEGPCKPQDLKAEVWQQDELVIFSKFNHPLASQSQVSLSELAQAQWILREAGSGTREIFERAAHKNINQLNVLLELGSAEAIKQSVKDSEALGCLSSLTLQNELASQTLVKLNVPELTIKRDLSMLMHPAKSESLILQSFRQICLANKTDKPRIKVKPTVT
ncbi:MAG: transcriptional regulator, LysR family [Gammaproteobacteria bacterium]|nr:transcriptional regulator, LysR family [Gammaproteobacteria bacterium]